jgi:tetratricopeptide (TPR) repeat protein
MSLEEEDEVLRFLGEASRASPVKFPFYDPRPSFRTSSGSSPELHRAHNESLESLSSMINYSEQVHTEEALELVLNEQPANMGETDAGRDEVTSTPQYALQREVDPGPSFGDRTFFESQYNDNARKTTLFSGTIAQPISVSTEEMRYTIKLAHWYFEKGDLIEADRLYGFLAKNFKFVFEGECDYLRIRLSESQIKCINGKFIESETTLKSLFNYLEMHQLKNDREMSLTEDTGRWLALAQWRQGKYSDAENTVMRCRSKLPRQKRSAPALDSTLALVLASKGCFKRALKLSRAVVRMKTAAHQTTTGSKHDKGYDRYKITSAEDRTCLFNHACILSELGKFDEATNANQIVLDHMQEELGPHHFVTLDAASLRAWLLLSNGNNTEAGEEVHRTLRQIRQHRGKDHPSTLQAVQTLVIMYKNQGRYSDAEETARYLVSASINSTSLGIRHPQTLKSKAILAEVLLSLGKWESAQNLQQEILDIQPNNPFFRSGFATILRVQGHWDEAREQAVTLLLVQLRALSDEDKRYDEEHAGESATYQEKDFENEEIDLTELKEILNHSRYVQTMLKDLPPGTDDPTTTLKAVRVYPSLVQVLYCVALCEQVRDNADLMFVQRVLEKLRCIFQRRLGYTHRLTTNVEYDLGVNYRYRGYFQESMNLLDKVVAERQKLLGSDHPDYLIAKHQQAITMSRLHKWQEAFVEQTSTLKVQEYLLGHDHADVISSRYALAGIHQSLNKLGEAKDLIVQVIDEQKLKFNLAENSAEDHPIVVRSRARYALILLDIGQYSSAELEQMEVVALRRKRLGKSHHLFRSSYNDLAQIKQATGKPEKLDEAEAIYHELVESFKKDPRQKDVDVRAPADRLFFQIVSNLATCYFDRGLYAEAEARQTNLYNALRVLQRGADRFIPVAFNLALTRKALGKHEEAQSLLYEAIVSAEALLGTTHSQTTQLRTTLATWQQETSGQAQEMPMDEAVLTTAKKNEDAILHNPSYNYDFHLGGTIDMSDQTKTLVNTEIETPLVQHGKEKRRVELWRDDVGTGLRDAANPQLFTDVWQRKHNQMDDKARVEYYRTLAEKRKIRNEKRKACKGNLKISNENLKSSERNYGLPYWKPA